MNKLLLSFCTLSFASISYAELNIQNAIVPEAPPTAKVLTAYMQLHNNINKPQTIISISSPQFQRIEIHRTEISNNIARMKLVKYIHLSPGVSVKLKAGGMHLMMFHPIARYKSGDCVKLILHFANNSTQNIHASVEKRQNTVDHNQHY